MNPGTEDQDSRSPSSDRVRAAQEGSPGHQPSADRNGQPVKKPAPRVGQFLRDAYRDAVDEGVPDDMMDLLRKLD